jgi:hypothetical protein
MSYRNGILAFQTRTPISAVSLLLALVILAACSDDAGPSSETSAASESTTDGTATETGDSTNAGATSGTEDSTTAAGCDAEPPANPVPPEICENPQPLSQGEMLSGWILCNGGTRHREASIACETPTDCETDADCGAGQICECSGASSTCITAYCTTNADCLAGYHCWRWHDVVACDGPHDRCRVEPCLNDGSVCEICEYQPSTCAMGCVDHGSCTG